MNDAGAALRGTPAAVVLAGTRGKVAAAWRRHFAEMRCNPPLRGVLVLARGPSKDPRIPTIAIADEPGTLVHFRELGPMA